MPMVLTQKPASLHLIWEHIAKLFCSIIWPHSRTASRQHLRLEALKIPTGGRSTFLFEHFRRWWRPDCGSWKWPLVKDALRICSLTSVDYFLGFNLTHATCQKIIFGFRLDDNKLNVAETWHCLLRYCRVCFISSHIFNTTGLLF